MADSTTPNAIFYITLIERALDLIERETPEITDPFFKAEHAIAIAESREALAVLHQQFRIQSARLKQAAA
ncbi:MAG: hypothetical protein AAF613_10115 [Pseudomonadota bacterium]